MERNFQNIIVKEGNLLELPDRAIEILKVKAGDAVKLLYTEDAIILMNDGSFAEKLLKKL
ncbi:MAG: hypothetical protein NC310_05980 [Roseburia sp.]|nr:hypothetical protein [Anaeroplasma bactoclasticum]MCM1196599.1 hypothetical protein [Roseburia sp.]MCM1556160.1 hypothetical protein [Anaeroplasma bactoclasticum]